MNNYLLPFMWILLSQYLPLPDKTRNEKFPLISIDAEANSKKMEVVNLSHFTDDIRYVPFENKGDIFFDLLTDFEISGNLVLVINHSDGVLLYDTKGHFIAKIGSKGRGPGEYFANDLIGIDNKKHIYIKSLFDLNEYKIDGSFVRKYKNTFLFNNKDYLYGRCLINDSLVLGHIINFTGQAEYKALLVNKQGGIKKYYKNYTKYKPEREYFTTDETDKTYYYRFNNKIYYKEFSNDTLFFLNDKFEMVPQYAFNLGKFKEPLSERAKLPEKRDFGKYFVMKYVYQTEKYLFINVFFGDHFPAKRLTPLKRPFSTVLKWENTVDALGIYDKETGELVFCKPTTTDNPLFTSGIYNDIDAGPRFVPRKQINDSTMVMWIDPKQLKEHVASNDFKKNTPKYPEKKKELEKLASTLTDFDNPILMLVTFKR